MVDILSWDWYFIIQVTGTILLGIYVIATYHMMKATQSLVEETKDARIYSNLPQIIAYFYIPKYDRLFLKIKNVGKTPAYKLEIDITPSKDQKIPKGFNLSVLGQNLEDLNSKKLSYFPSGYELDVEVNLSYLNYLNSENPKKFDFTLKYYTDYEDKINIKPSYEVDLITIKRISI